MSEMMKTCPVLGVQHSDRGALCNETKEAVRALADLMEGIDRVDDLSEDAIAVRGKLAARFVKRSIVAEPTDREAMVIEFKRIARSLAP